MNDYKELIAELRHYFYDEEDVLDAAYDIEQLAKERNVLEFQNHLERCEQEHTKKERDELTTKCCRLEHERDAAVAAVHKQCSTCKRVDFCATDAGQPTLWACVSAAKCNWEWRGGAKMDEVSE